LSFEEKIKQKAIKIVVHRDSHSTYFVEEKDCKKLASLRSDESVFVSLVKLPDVLAMLGEQAKPLIEKLRQLLEKYNRQYEESMPYSLEKDEAYYKREFLKKLLFGEKELSIK